jgi:hypothetical protein
VAVLGSILASKFHSSMAAAASARHLPAAVASSVHSDIGTALNVANTPANPLKQTITTIARQSFVTSFHLASLVGAVVILLAAAAVFVWLPARATDEEPVSVTAAEPALGSWDAMEPAFEA